MYITVIQGKGKIGFLECFEVKNKLKKLGARWHPSVSMWVLTTVNDIAFITNKLGIDAYDYRVGDSTECFGEIYEILFS